MDIKEEQNNIKEERSRYSLLVDTTFLFDQYSKRGIGRYGREVIKRFVNLFDEEPEWELHFIGFLTLEQNFIQLGLSQFEIENYVKKVKFHSIGEPFLSSVGNIQKWINLFLPIVEEVKPDIYYAINFERGLPTVPFFKAKLNTPHADHQWLEKLKTVVMAHDAIPLITNRFSSKGFLQNIIKGEFYKFMFKGVRNADLVLTNSNFSKEDLIKFGGINGEKIKPIYLGVTEGFIKETSRVEEPEVEKILNLYGLKDQKYFLYDSGVEANKGIDILLNIFKRVKEDPKIPQKLVLVGGDFTRAVGVDIDSKTSNGKKVIALAKSLGILDSLITTGRISEIDLQVMYFNASAYINLATYEGFSFGPVQAMAAEVPAIASNTSCTPEITDGGALLIDPNNIETSSDQIIKFLKNTKKVNEMIEKGKEIAKRYDWDKTAEATLEQIKKLKITN